MKNIALPGDKTPVVMAIIYQKGKYLMQLRDDIPGIVHPGVWGLFGGHLNPGEKRKTGLKRELVEEINYHVNDRDLTEFRCYADSKIVRYLFSCPLLVPIEQLQLNEGWDFSLLTPEEIYRGDRYSAKANQTRPLGNIHRQIMLDFVATQK